MHPLKSIDLFAGVGGIRLGFEKAFGSDLETVFASDINKFSNITYKANFDTPETIVGDIREVKAEDIPDFDICLAGFPCQAFSFAGRQLGFEDARGTLFFEVARICREKQPKVIFCENVKGLLSHDKGRTFKIISATFDEIGYDLRWKVLDTQDFGIAQHRERIYMVAFRKDLGVKEFSFPKPHDGPKPKLIDFLDPAPIGAKYFHSKIRMDGLRAMEKSERTYKMGFCDINGVFPTIVSSPGRAEKLVFKDERGVDWSKTSVRNKGVDPELIRMLTPRERFRLQGFPEDFKLPCSETQLYRQAGNSVSVNVIAEIAAKIKEALEAAGQP